MYNSTTEQKIKDIPTIGDIDIDRLPQDLTRIYAQIVSLRRQVVDGTINFQDEDLVSGLTLLRKLANNLETILLTFPQHEQKESIAFVAGKNSTQLSQNPPFKVVSPPIALVYIIVRL